MIEVMHGSALDIQPSDIPDNAVMITDPPYSDHVHEKMQSCSDYDSRSNRRAAGFASLSPKLRSHIAALGAQCRWSVVFSDWEGLGAWRAALEAHKDYRYIRVIPWVRWSMPQLSGDRPPQGSEAVIIAGPKGKMHWNGPGNLTHFNELAERGKEKHTTAKPLDLMMRIVSYFSDPGETIIDPCAGRGTTVLAAGLLGRAGLGIEINPVEAQLAQARVSERGLSARDAERAERFKVFAEAEDLELERMKVITNKARAKKGLALK